MTGKFLRPLGLLLVPLSWAGAWLVLAMTNNTALRGTLAPAMADHEIHYALACIVCAILLLESLLAGSALRKPVAIASLGLLGWCILLNFSTIPRIEAPGTYRLARLTDNSLLGLAEASWEGRDFYLRALLSGAYPKATVVAYPQYASRLQFPLSPDISLVGRFRTPPYDPNLTDAEAAALLSLSHVKADLGEAGVVYLLPGLPLEANEPLQVARHGQEHFLVPARLLPARMAVP